MVRWSNDSGVAYEPSAVQRGVSDVVDAESLRRADARPVGRLLIGRVRRQWHVGPPVRQRAVTHGALWSSVRQRAVIGPAEKTGAGLPGRGWAGSEREMRGAWVSPERSNLELQRLTICMTHKGARPTSYMDGDELNVRYRVTWRVCAYFNVHAAVTWNGSMEERATGDEITT